MSSSSASCTLAAQAKVNLSLHIPGKRADGYHQLEGLVAFAATGDELTTSCFNPTGQPDSRALQLDGPFAGGLQGEDSGNNLVLKAAKLFTSAGGGCRHVHFVLTKNLPVASGIGGGSADAAAALNALQQLSPTPLTAYKLHAVALELGADVPMCLQPHAQYVQGIGEICTPVSLPKKLPALLVNPGIQVSTGAIFKALAAGALAPDFVPEAFVLPADSSVSGLIDWLRSQRNDLQAPAIQTAPEIKDMLDILAQTTGCALARMSGSGATCFGLFEHNAQAEMAARDISALHPGWWVVATELG